MLTESSGKYDQSCNNCSSQGYAPDRVENYKEGRYFTIRLGPEKGNATVYRLCEKCLKRMFREYLVT